MLRACVHLTDDKAFKNVVWLLSTMKVSYSMSKDEFDYVFDIDCSWDYQKTLVLFGAHTVTEISDEDTNTSQ